MSRLREHETLFPVYPALQMQLIPAGLLAQAALGPQVILTFIKASLVIDDVRYGLIYNRTLLHQSSVPTMGCPLVVMRKSGTIMYRLHHKVEVST